MRTKKKVLAHVEEQVVSGPTTCDACGEKVDWNKTAYCPQAEEVTIGGGQGPSKLANVYQSDPRPDVDCSTKCRPRCATTRAAWPNPLKESDMLHLVRPRTEGQDPPTHRRKGTKPAALTLSPEECRRVRAALRNTALAYGGNDALAIVVGVPLGTIHGFSKVRSTISGTFAIRLAKAAGVSVESILSGIVTDASRCPTCSARLQPGGAR